MQSIDPRPVQQIAVADGVDLVFAPAGGTSPASIAFSELPAKAGPGGGEITLAGEPPVVLHQFVWP
ncbi:MAG TPA: hypothetical protein VK665_06720 [Candidatus Elarobacter sp.]|nr:hypothetical protein [Candidatus Elarobacter sp.]